MRTLAFCIALSLLALRPPPARAGDLPLGPLTLDQALATALRRNPDLLGARQRERVAQARLLKARYWNPFNPSLEAGAAGRRFADGGSAVQERAAVELEVEVAGQRRRRIREALQNLARVRAEIRDVERRLRADVKTAYYRVLYLRERLALFRRIQELDRRVWKASWRRFQSGEVPKLEANLAQARYVLAHRDTLAARRDDENARRALERLLGLEPTGTIRLSGTLDPVPVGASVQQLRSLALEHRPDLDARRAEIARLEAEAALMRRLVIPNPTFRAVYDTETESPGRRDRIFGAEIRLALPLFDRRQAELAALAGMRAEAAYAQRATALRVKSEVGDAFRSYRASLEAVTVLRRMGLPVIRESFRLIETAYREGKIGLLDLVVVQNDLVRAELGHLTALWEYWQARVALERAVGISLPPPAGGGR